MSTQLNSQFYDVLEEPDTIIFVLSTANIVHRNNMSSSVATFSIIACTVLFVSVVM